jgi:hypothetical protein
MKLSDQIRSSITSCGLSSYRIAVEAEVAESSLSRFLAEEHGLTTETLDRIGKVLGLEIISHGPNKALLKQFGKKGKNQ